MDFRIGVVGVAVDVPSVVESTTSVVAVAPVVVVVSVEVVVVVDDSVGNGVAVAVGIRAEPTDRTVTEAPPLESGAEALPVERVRALPADPVVRLGPEDWLELLPELLAECDADPESDDPPSVEAAATPCPTPTASPSPTAAATIPF
ncbi:hypothetical protein MycrhDRAFT_4939 [Mycolicibacterium rhodesiae JS60]|nr:hypothetical protein MycrhDRAFT_4939 [Mycolicibacterium rhodesiae JS60]